MNTQTMTDIEVITVTPTRDFAIINELANHPDIAPHIKDDSSDAPIDASVLNHKANIFLLVRINGRPEGFAIFMGRGVSTYEMHSGITKGHRGATALEAARQALEWIFTNTEAEMVSTWAWSAARNVIMMARWLGFNEDMRVAWPNTVGGEKVDKIIFSMSLMEWARKYRERFESDGWKLQSLTGAEQGKGILGIFARIALGGNLAKAQYFFNRWAVVYGLIPVQVLDFRAGSFCVVAGANTFEISPDLSISKIEGN